LGETPGGERLAAIETKLNLIYDKLNEKTGKDDAVEGRVRALEVKVGIILTVGTGAWAVILILVTQVFGKIWG